MSRKFITVQFQKEGVHHYPESDKNPSTATGEWDDVSFLAAPHFHYFFFKVSIEVFDDNREIEFIQFNRWVQRLYENKTLDLNHRSCEMMADELISQVSTKYPGRRMVVEIYEDNINGVRVEFDPPAYG